MLANKEDWNKLVMAAKMVSDPNIQVKLGQYHAKPTARKVNEASHFPKVLQVFPSTLSFCLISFFQRNALIAILMFFNVQNTLNVMFNISPHLHVRFCHIFSRTSSNLSPTGADLVATLPATRLNEQFDHICVKYILLHILALFPKFYISHYQISTVLDRVFDCW